MQRFYRSTCLSQTQKGIGGVHLDFYWSATVQADYPTSAWGVFLSDGNMGVVNYAIKNTNQYYIWCVRGPMQESAY